MPDPDLTFVPEAPHFTIAANAVTGGGAFALVVTAAVAPKALDWHAGKDGSADSQLFEHLTVLVLVVGIVAAARALWKYRDAWRSPFITAYYTLWTLACVYFAGEECSRGQWYFRYETPGPLAVLHDQGEANLHNIGSWLDQKPRALVEAFIVTIGLLVPVLLPVRAGRVWGAGDRMRWLRRAG